MRIAVIGLGAVGTRAARQVASTAEVESVVVADPKADRVGEVVASLGTKAVSHSLSAGLPEADVVILATPPGLQAPLADTLVARGTSVVCTTDGVHETRQLLDLGPEADWFESTEIVVLGVVAVVGLAVFIAWELTDAHPVVDLRLFSQRNFCVGVLVTGIGYGLFLGNVVLLPLWLQQWMGYTATQAGMALAPVGVLAILLSPLAGRKVAQWDPRWMTTAGFVVFAVVMWMRSGFTPQTDIATIMVPTLLQGAGLAFYFIPLTTLSLAGIPQARLPAAAGLSTFVRIASGAVGASVSTTVWESRAVMHHAHLVETLQPGSAALSSALATLQAGGLSEPAALAQLTRLIDQQAHTRAADDIFLVSAWLFLGLIALIWLTRRPPPVAPVTVPAVKRP